MQELGAAQDIQAGKLPEFYAFYDKNWKTYNAELHDSQRQLIEYLETVPAEAFKKDFGVRSGRGTRVTIARLLQAQWKDEQEHLQQIRDLSAKP